MASRTIRGHGVSVLALALVSAGPCERTSTVPLPPSRPTPREYQVLCRRKCSGDFTFYRRATTEAPLKTIGPSCERVAGEIVAQPMGMTIITRETDPAAQLAACLATFDELSAVELGGRRLTGVEAEWLTSQPDLRQSLYSTTCALYGTSTFRLNCEPPADDALVSVTDVTHVSSGRAPGAVSHADCSGDDRGTPGEPCVTVPEGCGTSPSLEGRWFCRFGALSCEVDEASFCRGGDAPECGGVVGDPCTNSGQCVPGTACDLRGGHCVVLPAAACPAIPSCWLPAETTGLCPVSDADPKIPASARECTEADEGSGCTGRVVGCGDALLPGKVTCVAGSKTCVHDPDVVRHCGDAASPGG